MEHAKKFMLVDPQFHRPTIKEKTLSKLDTAIEDILRSDLTEDEKAKRYTAALNRFRAIEEYSPRVSEALQKKDLETDVIRSVPLAQQYKAKRLLDYLKKDPEIQWTDSGQLVHHQNPVPRSNVVDLISDLLRKITTGDDPEGWREIADSLKKHNVPKEYVPNVRRWRYIRNDAQTDPVAAASRSPVTPPDTSGAETPKAASSSKAQQKPAVTSKAAASSKAQQKPTDKTTRSKRLKFDTKADPRLVPLPPRQWEQY